MSKPNRSRMGQDDTRVIYGDKLEELLNEIQMSRLSKEDLEDIENLVVRIKARGENGQQDTGPAMERAEA